MGAKAPKTGKVSTRTGITTPEGQQTYNLLDQLLANFEGSPEADALSKAGNDLLLRDTLGRNLGLAGNLMADEMAKQESNISRSLLGRGVSDSGFASSQLLGSNAQLRGQLINSALERSATEEAQAKTVGGELIKGKEGIKGTFAGLLSEYVNSLLTGGMGGQTSIYGARAGIRGGGQTAGAGLLGSLLGGK